MATRSWGTTHSVAASLFEEGDRFEFYQAVRLLEFMHPDRISVGESAEPDREAVRFRSVMNLSFPPSDIADIARPVQVPVPAEMAVSFLGLVGYNGPLPPPYTEWILERAFRGNTALRDFLDIFHHRLISLMYRLRRIYRVGLDLKSPEDSEAARCLFSFIGLRTKGLQGRLRCNDRALLHYAGLLSHHPRSMLGLEILLGDYFGAAFKGIPFCGQWFHLEEGQLTRIGLSGQNQRLGQEALLGARVWDQQRKFELVIGPLSYSQFRDLLPIGWGFLPLCGVTRFYVGDEHDVQFRLILKADEVPESRISVKRGPRLGWTSWLKTRPRTREGEVRLSPSALVRQVGRMRIPLFADLPMDELSEIEDRMTVHRVPADTVIMRQGDPGASLFIVSKGSVTMSVQELDGSTRHVATLKQGDFFGESSLLTGNPRPFTVVAAEDSEILELSRAALDHVIAQYPRIRHVLETFVRKRA